MRLSRMLITAHYSAFLREKPDGLSILGAIISTDVGRDWAATDFSWLRTRNATKYRKDEHNMLDLVVDVPNTFVGMMLRGCEPKMQRKDRENPNSDMLPAQDKNGVPKWTVYLSVETKSSF